MENNLCYNCQRLDFVSLARVELPISHMVTYRFGPLSEILIRQENCQFCSLVVCAFAATWKQKPPPTSVNGLPISCSLRNRVVGVVREGDDTPSYSDNFAANKYQYSNCRITITCDRAPPGCPATVEIQAVDQEVNIRGLFDDARLFSRRPKNQLVKINFDLVKKWVSYCRKCHGGSCDRDSVLQNHKDKYVSSFRLLDVKQSCVIDANADCSYVALSYVWGQVPMLALTLSNKSDLYKDGALARYLVPQTVKDAMEAVKQLQMEYLWVDALCIMQDDEVEKGATIGEMDLIYSRAELTIVAAFGNNANAGLPGLFPGTRVPVEAFEEKMSKVAHKLELVTARTIPSTVIDGSKWNTRGWTYQERLFSHRMLLFTEEQLLFWCGKGSWCEDTVLETDSKHVFYEGMPLYRFGIRNGSDPFMLEVQDSSKVSLFKEYSNSVSEYSRREFSFEGDILNAFAGLFNSVKSSYKLDLHALTFHFGLPSAWFELSLSWTSCSSLKVRRRGTKYPGRTDALAYPSWSWAGWAGWTGQVRFGGIGCGIRPEVEWYMFDADGTVFPIKSDVRYHYPPPDDIFNTVYKTSTYPRLLREKWKPVGVPVDVRQTGVLDQISNACLRTHLLMFYSSCAFLPLVKKRPGDFMSDENQYEQTYYIGGARQGYISIDDEWLANHPAPKYEFVVLSRHLGNDFECPGMLDSLAVMLIERRGEVAYRVSVGMVKESAWADAASEWQFVQLG